MHPLLMMLLTFLAVALGVVGVYSILSDLFLRDRARFSQRVDEEFRKRLRDQARKASLFKDLAALETEARADGVEPSLRQRLETMLEQSGLSLTPGHLLALSAGVGLVLGTLGFLFHSHLAGAGAALLGAAAPSLYVYRKRAARRNKLLSQLPDTFDLMARVIRAGQTVPQALQAVADEFDAPVSSEFSYCYEQQNLGLPPEVAFRDLARRCGLIELKIFVLAMLVQQQTGGNLAELLEKLAAVIRERFRVRDKIRALTAEGRYQAGILLALAPVMLGIILFLNRNYAQVLLDRPNLLVVMVILELLGALWIRKIVNFDF